MPTRDLSTKEFRAAVKWHGWTISLCWVNGTGKDGCKTGVGFVLHRRRGHWVTNRRATLAKCRHILVSATEL